jgi:cytidine deaminase
MEKKDFSFSYEEYNSVDDLLAEDAFLLTKARAVTANAYAPYSNFQVGAVARLNNGQVVTGTNQENASFPAGLCAERVLLSGASSLFPNIPIKTMAISYNNLNGKSGHPITPCGVCRQSLVEYEARSNQSIRLILAGMDGKVHIIEKAGMMLPLSFSANDMKQV